MSLPTGLLPRAGVAALIARGAISAERVIEPSQIQPASLDLRLAKEAYRLRASFLPGRGATRARAAGEPRPRSAISLEGEGAVLEKGIVYVAPLCERLALPETLAGAANPKSSTGRLDIFVRLIVDNGAAFDEAPAGYHGPLWVEISPRSFSVRVREGTRLNQLRLRDRRPRLAAATRPARPPRAAPLGRRRAGSARRALSSMSVWRARASSASAR